MSAKSTANMAATAKRSATSIRHLVRCLDGLSQAEKNTLIDAGRILEKHGNKAKSKAASEKRAEQLREKAQAKARAEALAIIRAWPQADTLDRIAIIHATRAEAGRLVRGEDRNNPSWELDYATREAVEDIVSDAVMYAVPYSSTAAVPVASHMAQRRALVDQIRVRPGIVALAAEWDGRLARAADLQPRAN